MKIVEPKHTSKKEVQVGDILIISEREIYVVSRTDDKVYYKLAAIGNQTWANGKHGKIEDMLKSLDSSGIKYKHYSKEEFELALQKKS